MSTHNICFHSEIRKMSAFLDEKKCLISCYVKQFAVHPAGFKTYQQVVKWTCSNFRKTL